MIILTRSMALTMDLEAVFFSVVVVVVVLYCKSVAQTKGGKTLLI